MSIHHIIRKAREDKGAEMNGDVVCRMNDLSSSSSAAAASSCVRIARIGRQVREASVRTCPQLSPWPLSLQNATAAGLSSDSDNGDQVLMMDGGGNGVHLQQQQQQQPYDVGQGGRQGGQET